jgi:teichuronic acid biosynthesis glycosyltransferase TuaH
VVTSSPHHFVFGVCGEAVRVYYAFDDFAAGASLQGVPPSRLARSEARAAREADVVVAASPVLRDAWSAAGARTILLPNGVDAGFLATAEGSAEPADIRVPPPIAGFVGHISDRIDLSLLHSVAERGISLLLVGPRQATFRSDAEFDRLLSAPNVQWAGPKPYEELPRYLGAMSVGLVPYTGSPFNRASFPLKALEYLAAGLAVVSTDLPSVRWLDTELIDIAPGRTEFSSAVQRHLGDADGETRAARRSFGAAHDWDRRVDRLAKVLAVSG